MSDKPLLPLGSDVIYKVDILWGHVEVRPYLEWRDGKIIGMSEAKHYNERGDLVKRVVSETGITASVQ